MYDPRMFDKKFIKGFNSLVKELEEIEDMVSNGQENENISKIETFMSDFFLFVRIYVHKVEESPPYQKLVKLYVEDKLYILNMKNIIAICWGFLRNLER